MYKISIIIPVFNVEKYIERALKSILNQTMNLEDIEVIIVDDCSTDNTQNIIRTYEERYSNFKTLYLKKNTGNPSTPRNKGIELASGEYLMFLDPDDEYIPDMCEKLYNTITKNDVKLVKCNNELILDGISRKFYELPKKNLEVELNCKTDNYPSSGSVCNAIHEKKFIIENNIRFPDLNVGEDVIFCITEYMNVDKIILLNNYHGYRYYANDETSHSRKPTTKNLEDTLNTYFTLKNLIKQNKNPEKLKLLFTRHCTRFFIMLLEYDGDDKKYLKKFYEFEHNLNINLEMEYLWLRIINTLILKKQFSLGTLYLKILRFIRNSPLLKLYRKSL